MKRSDALTEFGHFYRVCYEDDNYVIRECLGNIDSPLLSGLKKAGSSFYFLHNAKEKRKKAEKDFAAVRAAEEDMVHLTSQHRSQEILNTPILLDREIDVPPLLKKGDTLHVVIVREESDPSLPDKTIITPCMETAEITGRALALRQNNRQEDCVFYSLKLSDGMELTASHGFDRGSQLTRVQNDDVSENFVRAEIFTDGGLAQRYYAAKSYFAPFQNLGVRFRLSALDIDKANLVRKIEGQPPIVPPVFDKSRPAPIPTSP